MHPCLTAIKSNIPLLASEKVNICGVIHCELCNSKDQKRNRSSGPRSVCAGVRKECWPLWFALERMIPNVAA